jgi:hypothetical protein
MKRTMMMMQEETLRKLMKTKAMIIKLPAAALLPSHHFQQGGTQGPAPRR